MARKGVVREVVLYPYLVGPESGIVVTEDTRERVAAGPAVRDLQDLNDPRVFLDEIGVLDDHVLGAADRMAVVTVFLSQLVSSQGRHSIEQETGNSAIDQ